MADGINPSRIEGWPGDIDHTKWHMVVDGDSVVMYPLPPHVQGTLGVRIFFSDYKVVEIDPPTSEEQQLYKRGVARVEAGKLVPSNGYNQVKADDADQKTRTEIGKGVEYNGQVYSLSPNAVAKYTAARSMADDLIYPMTFSTKNNGDEVILQDADDMRAFTGEMLGAYLDMLANGDQVKGKIRRAKNPKEVDDAVAEDTR